MQVSTIALIGPHGAGKSTLGRALADRLGWVFHGEIGERLRRKALREDPGAHAFLPQPAFDEQVIRNELDRDALWRLSGGRPRVVETWHPGNLAYAAGRSPVVYSRWVELAKRTACATPGLVVVPLRIRHDTAALRRSEPGPPNVVEGFLEVGRRAEGLAAGWGLRVAEAVWTDGVGAEEVAERVLGAFAGAGERNQ